MPSVTAILIKPLNHHLIGEEVIFSKADFDKLEAQGAVKRKPATKAKSGGKAKAASRPANKMEMSPDNKAAG